MAPTSNAAFVLGTFEVDTVANTVDYKIIYGVLSSTETGAHIHGPAPIGSNGGVQHTLPTGQHKVGTWNYPESLEADLLAGQMYINIHTSNNPGGELRAQIVDLMAQIDGLQVVPPTTSPSLGYGIFVVDTSNNMLHFTIDAAGLSGAETSAHIHGAALFTQTAATVFTLPAGFPKTGSWNYPAAVEGDILAGRMYVRINTTTFPGGEVRGQIAPHSILDASQVVPPASSGHFGIAFISHDSTDLGYDIRRSSPGEIVSHVRGPACPGTNGPVVFTLPPEVRKIGLETIGATAISDYENRLLYVNVETMTFPAGEIRGQLLAPLHSAAPTFDRGDCDNNGSENIADAIWQLAALFPGPSGANVPDCDDACDHNDDGSLNLADPVTLLNKLFPSGPPVTLAAPDGFCGVDPTSDTLDCSMPHPGCP